MRGRETARSNNKGKERRRRRNERGKERGGKR